MRSFPIKIEPAYFDLAGASAYLGGALEVRTLRRLIMQADGLPHYRIGARGKIMIRRADLDAFLMANRHEPQDLNAIADQAIKDLQLK
jgi:hypothetical protein